MTQEKKSLQKSLETALFEKENLQQELSKAVSDKKSLEEKIEKKTSKSIPQANQQEKILKFISENTRLKKLFENFQFSQKSLDTILAGTRRSHNLNGLGYSPQQNYSRSHVTSTSKNHAHSYFNKHHAPNRCYRYKANHAGVSYNAVGRTRARYEKITIDQTILSFMILKMHIVNLDME